MHFSVTSRTPLSLRRTSRLWEYCSACLRPWTSIGARTSPVVHWERFYEYKITAIITITTARKKQLCAFDITLFPPNVVHVSPLSFYSTHHLLLLLLPLLCRTLVRLLFLLLHCCWVCLAVFFTRPRSGRPRLHLFFLNNINFCYVANITSATLHHGHY